MHAIHSIPGRLAVTLTLALLTQISQAQIIELERNRALLTGAEVLEWPGANGQTQPNPLTLDTPLGLGVTASMSGGDFTIFHENTGNWNGMFNNGEHLLYTGDGNNGPITITFDSPVRAAGVQLQPRLLGNQFIALLSVFDFSGAKVFSGITPIQVSDSNRGTAPFLGVSSTSPSILRLEYHVFDVNTGLEQPFSVNQLSIVPATPVPEPEAYAALCALGLLGFAMSRRLRKSRPMADPQVRNPSARRPDGLI